MIMHIDHAVTADMPDGQSLPPYFEDDVVWQVVCRSGGRTTWRRIRLAKAETENPVGDASS
jgi:hypothetical protein